MKKMTAAERVKEDIVSAIMESDRSIYTKWDVLAIIDEVDTSDACEDNEEKPQD